MGKNQNPLVKLHEHVLQLLATEEVVKPDPLIWCLEQLKLSDYAGNYFPLNKATLTQLAKKFPDNSRLIELYERCLGWKDYWQELHGDQVQQAIDCKIHEVIQALQDVDDTLSHQLYALRTRKSSWLYDYKTEQAKISKLEAIQKLINHHQELINRKQFDDGYDLENYLEVTLGLIKDSFHSTLQDEKINRINGHSFWLTRLQNKLISIFSLNLSTPKETQTAILLKQSLHQIDMSFN